MKKIISILCALTVMTGFCACGISETKPSEESTQNTIETQKLSYDCSYENLYFSLKYPSEWTSDGNDDRGIELSTKDGSYIYCRRLGPYESVEKMTADEFLYDELNELENSNIFENENEIKFVHFTDDSGDVEQYMCSSYEWIIKFEFSDFSEDNKNIITDFMNTVKIKRQKDNRKIITPKKTESPTLELTDSPTSTEKFTKAPTDPPTESAKAYKDGMFKVGTDMESGEYMLFSTSSSGYLCVSTDANEDDIIYNENFGNNLIATFSDGEYVKLSRCMAIPFDVIPDDISSLLNDYIDSGAMYKVGKNIPAGEYKLTSTTDIMGYYCIYSDSRFDNIIANDNFDNETYVNVSDGEYLLLSRCKIIE